ncbi:MAG: hypothetical protein K2H88_01670 [Duncaniella sp.]|nr:hypothetical protein [Duncaniella sp.]
MSAPAVSHAFTIGGDNGVALHGSVQADVLFPQEDETINTGKYDKDILFNTYADLNMISRYVDAGVRLEFMKWPLPGYEPDFAGWGVPNIYVKGRYKGFELTAGDFYEQLGIDNSIRGGRLKINALRGFNFTLLGGLQRRYWDWKKQSQVYGGDMEINFSELSKSLSDRGIGWTFGASYVLKHENDEDKAISGTDYRLNLPKSVGAFDLRTNFRKGNFGVLGEFAWKGQDPSEDNGYTYGKGTAVMLSGSYSRSGMSVLLQAKRSENMAFRSQRSMSGTSAFLNNMPAFAYQHTYSLPALYPYATQAAPGEWAFQGSFAYTFKRKTPLGGKYGTKVKINASYIRGLDRKAPAPLLGNTIMGTDGYSSSFFKMGGEYYHDCNIQIEKKRSRSYNLSFMYMNQMDNNDVLKISEVDNTHKIRTNIFVLDGKWSIDRRYTLRTELQYLTTRQDQKDWVYGLVELSVAPYLMFTLSDMWNCGDTGTHYYMGGITGNYRSNRLMLSYGRTREGFNCSGGVCRKVPSTHGFQIAYTYNF